MAVNLGDIASIQEHLNAYEGVEEENVLSDIEELGRRDPTLFTGPLGEDAQLYLDDAKRQIAAGQKNEASASLDKVLDLLEGKLRGVGGKRRRKTRKSQKAGFNDLKVTIEDLQNLGEKLDAGNVQVDNLVSDFEDLRRDNTLFTGPHGTLANQYLNEAKDWQNKDRDANVKGALEDALHELVLKVREVGGKRRRGTRRGRTSRRKSLRQRK